MKRKCELDNQKKLKQLHNHELHNPNASERCLTLWTVIPCLNLQVCPVSQPRTMPFAMHLM